MNKKMFLSALAALIVVCSTGVSYAQDVLFEDKAQPVMQEKRRHFAPPSKHKFKHQGLSKAEIEAKKLEFEKRLNLTEEQKLQIEKNKQKDKEKIKPLFEEMKVKRGELRSIRLNPSLSELEKSKKSAVIEKELIDLRVKADELRVNNMKNFENILTKEQKMEFAKIKEEQKKEMEERKMKFHSDKKLPPYMKKEVNPDVIKIQK